MTEHDGGPDTAEILPLGPRMQRDAARAAVAAIAALHKPVDVPLEDGVAFVAHIGADGLLHRTERICNVCATSWPCETTRICDRVDAR